MRQLIAATQTLKDRALIEFFYGTGCRMNETRFSAWNTWILIAGGVAWLGSSGERELDYSLPAPSSLSAPISMTARLDLLFRKNLGLRKGSWQLPASVGLEHGRRTVKQGLLLERAESSLDRDQRRRASRPRPGSISSPEALAWFAHRAIGPSSGQPSIEFLSNYDDAPVCRALRLICNMTQAVHL